MIPYDVLPQTVHAIARLLPASYSMAAYAGFALDGASILSPLWSLVILTAGGLLAFGLAIGLFNWDSHNSTARWHPALGLLAVLPYALGALLLG